MSERVGILSHIVTDEVFDAAGQLTAVEVGGAGAYAAVGSSLVTRPDATILFSGVGSSDLARLREWLRKREVSPDGLFVHGEHSPVTEVRYDATGERIETPRYGLDHFLALSPMPHQVEGHELAGAYIFRDLDPEFWAELPVLRDRCTGPILWELHAGVCDPRHLSDVTALAEQVDILSINRTEACLLTGSNDPLTIFHHIPSRCAVALRLGGEGSILRAAGRAWRLGTSPTSALDPTGGGNSWSGALVAHAAVGGDPVAAARAATAAAAVVIAEPGAPEVSDELRRQVAQAAVRVSCERMEAVA